MYFTVLEIQNPIVVQKNTLSVQVGERIRVILDCDDNTLAFERNYEFLGVAFRGEILNGNLASYNGTYIRVLFLQVFRRSSFTPLSPPFTATLKCQWFISDLPWTGSAAPPTHVTS